MRLGVLHQVALLDERLSALGAQERLLARVLPHVEPELGRPAEPLAADGALLRPARVDPHVRLEHPRLVEAFAADGARVRPLAGVRTLVDDEVVPGAHQLAAVRAFVGRLAGVDARVDF